MTNQEVSLTKRDHVISSSRRLSIDWRLIATEARRSALPSMAAHRRMPSAAAQVKIDASISKSQRNDLMSKWFELDFKGNEQLSKVVFT